MRRVGLAQRVREFGSRQSGGSESPGGLRLFVLVVASALTSLFSRSAAWSVGRSELRVLRIAEETQAHARMLEGDRGALRERACAREPPPANATFGWRAEAMGQGPGALKTSGCSSDGPGDGVGHVRLVSVMPAPRREAPLVGGRWERVRPLAEGGMGEVWVARHAVTGRYAALKILDRSSHEGIAERFRREAAVTAELGHPGIVEVLDAGFGDTEQSFYIAMELLDGCTLEERMADPLASPEEILALIDATLVPLAAAHDRRVVHRDLKPANIFVTSGGSSPVKLLDFGIARDTTVEGMTMTGTSMGTPAYMSPEQALDARRVTPATDVWAVGVMLYEALSGERPFSGQTAHGIIVAACTEPHLPLVEIAPGVDPSLSALVDRCLSKNPLERPADARELRRELAPFIVRSALASLAPGTPSLRPTSVAPQPAPRSLWPLAVLGVGGVVTAVGATLMALDVGGLGSLLVGGATLLSGALVWGRGRREQKRRSIRPLVQRRFHDQAAPSLGTNNPTVALLAFADLADPSSRKLIRDLRDLAEVFGDDLRISFRCLPGDTEVSIRVAEAAHEAFAQRGDEGFWGLQELLHRGKRAPSLERLEAHAETLGLHRHGLRHALRIQRHRDTIRADRELADSLGVDTASAVFLDGVRVRELDRGALMARIERALGRAPSARPSHTDTVPGRLHPVGLRYVLVQWRGAEAARPDVQRSKAAALDRAWSIQRRAMLPESHFAMLGRRFADECHDLGVKPPNGLPRWVRKTAAALEIGEVSEPLETERGWAVVRRYA